MRNLLATTCLVLAFASPALAAPEKYEMDTSHTNVLFFVNHLGFSETVGRFEQSSGTLMLDQDNPENSSVNVTMSAKSVQTQSKELNEHLQAKDWFNTAQYPDIKFVSKSVKKTGATTADVTGDLTLLGVTKPVTLKAKLNKADYFEMAKAWVAGFNGETTIKRSDFGMNNYVPMIGDEVKIMISTEFHNKEKPAPVTGAATRK